MDKAIIANLNIEPEGEALIDFLNIIGYNVKLHKNECEILHHNDIIDDIIALGGTMEAAINLVQSLGGEVVGIIALIGLTALPGVEKLKDYNLHCLMLDGVKED